MIDTIFLHKNVRHSYSDNNGNSHDFNFDTNVIIDGSRQNGETRHTIDFEGINNLSLTKNLTLKNVHLVIQPVDPSLAAAVAGAGTGRPNELDPKIYLNGHKLTLDNVDTRSDKLDAFTRPNIYLGAYNDAEQGEGGELLVQNTKNNSTIATTELKNVVLNASNSNKVTLNTNTNVKKNIEINAPNADLTVDSYRQNLRITKQLDNDPTVNLTLKNFDGKDIPEALNKLNNLNLTNSTPAIKHNLDVTGTLTINDDKTKITVGDQFDEDNASLTILSVNNISSQGGGIGLEGAGGLSITGELTGSGLDIDNKGREGNFSFNNHSDYENRNESGKITYSPRSENTEDHSAGTRSGMENSGVGNVSNPGSSGPGASGGGSAGAGDSSGGGSDGSSGESSSASADSEGQGTGHVEGGESGPQPPSGENNNNSPARSEGTPENSNSSTNSTGTNGSSGTDSSDSASTPGSSANTENSGSEQPKADNTGEAGGAIGPNADTPTPGGTPAAGETSGPSADSSETPAGSKETENQSGSDTGQDDQATRQEDL
ncbi:hypothetical protein GVX81_11175, partial [[Haemophilus] felis]|nr:hypothetical protein [[Haemophilus] felis]